MEVGIRNYKKASLRVAVPTALPDHMQSRMRELVGIKSESPQCGEASALMHKVCQEADDARMTLLLQVRAFDEGMTTERLEKWYGKFGFEVIQTEPALMMARRIQPNRIIH